MLNISKKLLSTLLGFGVSEDVAGKLSASLESLGDSDAKSFERDNYEITVAAKALASLCQRHVKDNSPADEFNKETEAEYEVHKLDITEDSVDDSKPRIKPESKFWKKLEAFPKFWRELVSWLLPALLAFGMILLTSLVIGLVIAFIVLMLGVTVAGIVLFIAGLLYGISQLKVFPAAAYYEIGFGLVIGGVASLLTVLCYNVITRLLPFALKAGNKAMKRLIIRFRRFRSEMREIASA